jgi:hypothetical protein
MKPYRGVEVQFQSFLTSALDGSGQLHAPAAFISGEEPRYPANRRPGGPRAGRSVLEKRKSSLPAENLTPYSPAATKSPHCPNSHPTSVRTSPTLTFRNCYATAPNRFIIRLICLSSSSTVVMIRRHNVHSNLQNSPHTYFS